MRLVSACLLGVRCTFEGKNCLNPDLLKEFVTGNLFPICPEVMGGLSVPRVPSEIIGGDGSDVLEGKAKVVNIKGIDVTKNFLKGAYDSLMIAKSIGAKEALLTKKSPSCGYGLIFDGTFSNRLITGDGVTVSLLRKNGIEVRCIKTHVKE